jgi:hypothetical protein
MKTTIAALTFIVAVLAPTVSMANIGDSESYKSTYPISQSLATKIADQAAKN